MTQIFYNSMLLSSFQGSTRMLVMVLLRFIEFSDFCYHLERD